MLLRALGILFFVVVCVVPLILFIRFPQTVETIIPLLEALSKDVEPVVKQHLVEQIKNLAKVLALSCL
jgi:hypothetical protein